MSSNSYTTYISESNTTYTIIIARASSRQTRYIGNSTFNCYLTTSTTLPAALNFIYTLTAIASIEDSRNSKSTMFSIVYRSTYSFYKVDQYSHMIVKYKSTTSTINIITSKSTNNITL